MGSMRSPLTLQELRAHQLKLQALGVEARAESLAAIGKLWARPSSQPALLFDTLAPRLGLHPAMLKWGIQEGLGQWRKDLLLRLGRQ